MSPTVPVGCSCKKGMMGDKEGSASRPYNLNYKIPAGESRGRRSVDGGGGRSGLGGTQQVVPGLAVCGQKGSR